MSAETIRWLGTRPRLTALRVSEETMDLVPAIRRRDWMDATPVHFANRCLPLLMANQSGWFVTTRRGVLAEWDGGVSKSALTITPLHGADDPPATSHFGSGILTWTMPWLFRTDPGWNLLARGPANWPKDGLCALEGLVESDWASATFTMNWQLTRPGLTVRFEPGEPICLLVPEPRGLLEAVEPTITAIEGEDAEEYAAWRESRKEFNAALPDRADRPLIEQWQRDYFQGTTEAAVSAGHQRRRVLAGFDAGDATPAAISVPRTSPPFGLAHLAFLSRCVEDVAPDGLLAAEVDVLTWTTVLSQRPRPQRTALRSVADSDLDRALDARSDGWDIVSLGTMLAATPRPLALSRLERAITAGRYVVAQVPTGRSCDEEGLDLADLLDAGALRHEVDHDTSTAVVVLSRDDPSGLSTQRRLSMAAQVWAQYPPDDGASPCGPGSSLAQTVVLREQIPQLLARHDVRSMIDAPCGDGNWMQYVLLADVDYLGLDISEELLMRARSAIRGPSRRFACLDVVTDSVPCADLILCRDLLVHLPFDQALRVLANFEASGSSCLLTTTFPERSANIDIVHGDWRPLNLQLPPFCLPPPIELIVEQCTEGGAAFADKSLGLWLLPRLLR